METRTRHLTPIYRMIEVFGGMLMPVTTFSGTVEDGQVKLAANVHLPEKTKVYVVVPDFDEKANGKKFDLAELASRMPADYQATEEGFGEPVGKEEW